MINNKIGNKTVYVRYITLNTKHHYGLNVKMLNYYISIHLNEVISEIIIAIWLSDFQRNQSEILIILPNFSNFSNLILKNLKKCNKLIAKNIVLGVQINSVHKDGSSCCEWFIVTADLVVSERLNIC